MKATELRIGNYVYNKTDGVIKVEEVNDDGINGEFDLCWASYYFEPTYAGVEKDLIEPIHLTEEWLLKFGFENDVFKASGIIVNRYKIKGICLSIDTRKESEHKYLLFKEDKFIKTIKFINELQNLYFALTGEELEIK